MECICFWFFFVCLVVFQVCKLFFKEGEVGDG